MRDGTFGEMRGAFLTSTVPSDGTVVSTRRNRHIMLTLVTFGKRLADGISSSRSLQMERVVTYGVESLAMDFPAKSTVWTSRYGKNPRTCPMLAAGRAGVIFGAATWLAGIAVIEFGLRVLLDDDSDEGCEVVAL